MAAHSDNYYYNLDTSDFLNQFLNGIRKKEIEVIIKIGEDFQKCRLGVKNNVLLCFPNQPISNNENTLIVLFNKDGYNYLFKTAIKDTDPQVLSLDKPTQLFKLQRREDFRVKINEHFPYDLKIKTLNSKKIKLIDISLGGAKIKITDLEGSAFQINQTIEIDLSLMNLELIDIKCVIKFVKFDEGTYLGLEFAHLSPEIKENLNSVIMQLDRIVRTKK